MSPEIKPPRVAYFAGSMKPGHDGVTRVLYKLIEGLNKNGIPNIFFSPIIPPPAEQPVNMYEVPSVVFPLYKDYRFALPAYSTFEKQLNKFNPDIIHINSPCSLGCAAIKYGQKYKIPVVATYHTHFASYAKYYKIKMLESFSWGYFRSLYNKCELVYVPSVPVMKELENHGLNTVTFLPHGVDLSLFNPKFRDEKLKRELSIEGKLALLFVGRLVWEKDLKTLADAFTIINKKRDDAVFIIVGDGPIRNKLEELMPGAKFLGFKTGIELSRIFASSDIFIFPSTTETFGNVTLEAMASAVPPICANEGGAIGFIKDKENGLLTKPRNAEDLAEKIIYVMDRPLLRSNLSLNAFNFAKEQTWDKIFERLFKSYNEVINNYKLAKKCRHSAAA
jgi:glycosyltransferase involved in cell wall biosynthesis